MIEDQPVSVSQPAAEGEPGAKDGPAANDPKPGEYSGERPSEEKIRAEESLNYEPSASHIRMDFAAGSQYRDIAGSIHNYYYGGSTAGGTSRGWISVTDLRRIWARHVTAPQYGALRDVLHAQRVAILYGTPGTGRGESAIMALDELTGRSRETSLLILLDPAGGLEAAIRHLTPGHGHVLKAPAGPWDGSPGEQAQLNQARDALGDKGYLVIVADSADIQSAAGHGVEHVPPDPDRVAAFHLAAELTATPTPGEIAGDGRTPRDARRQAETIIAEACAADESTRRWREELRGQAVPKPAEATTFADAVLDWHKRRVADPGAKPRAESFRMRYRYDHARRLLRHRHGMASPVPQSYLIAAAVLNGLNANDVVAGAVRLRSLLPWSPAAPDVIFEEPLSRRVAPAELATDNAGNGTVVRMQSPEMARCVIETAWREYDGVREPMLDWLLNLCEDEGSGDDVRARGVQALACIAADDHALIRKRVLDRWADSRAPDSHVAAGWLLEAMVQDGAATDKVLALLRNWSREASYGKRRIALRAYGTSIAKAAPRDAIEGVRFSADLATFSVLPELALREMYRLGMVAEVMAELVTWPHGLPAARRRAGLAMVRIAYIRGDGQDCPNEKYDLLWRLAHAPGQVGASLSQIAGVWQMACLDDKSAKDAWRVLCDWADSCVGDRSMGMAFAELAAELEKIARVPRLRERIGRYRQWWDRNLAREDET